MLGQLRTFFPVIPFAIERLHATEPDASAVGSKRKNRLCLQFRHAPVDELAIGCT